MPNCYCSWGSRDISEIFVSFLSEVVTLSIKAHHIFSDLLSSALCQSVLVLFEKIFIETNGRQCPPPQRTTAWRMEVVDNPPPCTRCINAARGSPSLRQRERRVPAPSGLSPREQLSPIGPPVGVVLRPREQRYSPLVRQAIHCTSKSEHPRNATTVDVVRKWRSKAITACCPRSKEPSGRHPIMKRTSPSIP